MKSKQPFRKEPQRTTGPDLEHARDKAEWREWLKKTRESRNVSQLELAALISPHLSADVVSSWERPSKLAGRCPPRWARDLIFQKLNGKQASHD